MLLRTSPIAESQSKRPSRSIRTRSVRGGILEVCSATKDVLQSYSSLIGLIARGGIGAHRPENSEGGTPAAYLFTLRDLHWHQDTIYRPEPSALKRWFGWSVALLDGSAFVSAHRAQSPLTGNPEVGSVALFETGFRDGFEPHADAALITSSNNK